MSDPLKKQVGGGHYKAFPIQPVEFIQKNGLDFCTGNVIKYVCRRKGNISKMLEDLDKAIHYIELRKQFLSAGIPYSTVDSAK